MSDLGSIHFNSFLAQRREGAKNLQVKEYFKHMQTLATFILASNKLVAVSESVNQMLSVLHKSAVKNNDLETLAKVEELAALALKAGGK